MVHAPLILFYLRYQGIRIEVVALTAAAAGAAS
jgi:hypothetical protein